MTLQRLFAYAFRPLMWLIGIPGPETAAAASLMGTKTVLNEFIAYVDLSQLPGDALSEPVGIAVSAFCEAIIRYVMIDEAHGIGAALVWLTGSLAAIDMKRVWETLPWVAVLVPLVGFYAHRLDLLQLGDDMAQGLGVAVERTRRLTLLFAVLLASACVAVAGSILFIGLIAPHMARRLVGTRHAVLLPAAAAIGTLMLLVADAIGRGAHPPIEMPAGMVTALIGAPYFVYLLTRSL